ncbi:hypothetical protein D6792_00970 [Candidatus Parcubacteria bacterium]|nr:MAG: hypothetical protein D6792_00970 [Candidatus Parcubacteria bacterium]GIW69001.1 MAG: hypothetical protein KatS3mg100_495 [Candidatus Parcubacteria bacterium]
MNPFSSGPQPPRPLFASEGVDGSHVERKEKKGKEQRKKQQDLVISEILSQPQIAEMNTQLEHSGLQNAHQLLERIARMQFNNLQRLQRALLKMVSREYYEDRDSLFSVLTTLLCLIPHQRWMHLVDLAKYDDLLKQSSGTVPPKLFHNPEEASFNPSIKPLWQGLSEELQPILQKAEALKEKGAHLAGIFFEEKKIAGEPASFKDLARAFIESLKATKEKPQETEQQISEISKQLFDLFASLRRYLSEIPALEEREEHQLDADIAQLLDKRVDFSNPFLYKINLTPIEGRKQQAFAIMHWHPSSDQPHQLGELTAIVPRLSVVSGQTEDISQEMIVYSIVFTKEDGIIQATTTRKSKMRLSVPKEGLPISEYVAVARQQGVDTAFNPTPYEDIIEQQVCLTFRLPIVIYPQLAYNKQVVTAYIEAKRKLLTYLNDVEFGIRVWTETQKQAVITLLQERYGQEISSHQIPHENQDALWGLLADAYLNIRQKILDMPIVDENIHTWLERLDNNKPKKQKKT